MILPPNQTLIIIFEIIFGFGFLVYAIAFLIQYLFINRLKNYHAEKWKDLGEPTLIINNSLRNNFRILKFTLSKDPLYNSDTILSRLRWFTIVVEIPGITLFLSLLIIFFLFFVNGLRTVE